MQCSSTTYSFDVFISSWAPLPYFWKYGPLEKPDRSIALLRILKFWKWQQQQQQ